MVHAYLLHIKTTNASDEVKDCQILILICCQDILVSMYEATYYLYTHVNFHL